MHDDPICAGKHAYRLRILNKLSVTVNGYTFMPNNHVYNKNKLNKLSRVVNGYTFTSISHAMRWAIDEDHHVI